MNESADFFNGLSRLHTTPLGEERIMRNLGMSGSAKDLVKTICQHINGDNAGITRKGKNWYVEVGSARFTINASSFTIITAHRI